MQGVLFFSGQQPAEIRLERGVADHRSGVGERRVLPAMAADLHEPAQAIPERRAAEARKRRGLRPPRVLVRRALERLDPAGEEQVLPDDRSTDPSELERLHGSPAAPVRTPLFFWRDVFRADELIERAGQLLAEWRRAQHRVDAGEVVVHPRAMDADDPVQRVVDRGEPAGREAERAAEVQEVMVVAGGGHGVEQWSNRFGKVLVDVCVRPQNLARLPRKLVASAFRQPSALVASAVRRKKRYRGDRTCLHKPDSALSIDGPLDVLGRSERRGDAAPFGGKARRRFVRHHGARGGSPSTWLGAGDVTDLAGPIHRHSPRVDAARDKILSRPCAIFEKSTLASPGILREEHAGHRRGDLFLNDDAEAAEHVATRPLVGAHAIGSARPPALQNGRAQLLLVCYVRNRVKLTRERGVGRVFAGGGAADDHDRRVQRAPRVHDPGPDVVRNPIRVEANGGCRRHDDAPRDRDAEPDEARQPRRLAADETLVQRLVERQHGTRDRGVWHRFAPRPDGSSARDGTSGR